MARPTAHFHPDEFRCRHCGRLWELSQELLDRLESLRLFAGARPLVIRSGFRCPLHNRNVGGAPKSYHLKGMAADLDASRQIPLKLAKRAGFTGIGVNSRGHVVHVDVRPGKVVVFDD